MLSETSTTLTYGLHMAIEGTVSSDFDPRSSIVKSVFNWRLSGMITTGLSSRSACRICHERIMLNYRSELFCIFVSCVA